MSPSLLLKLVSRRIPTEHGWKCHNTDFHSYIDTPSELCVTQVPFGVSGWVFHSRGLTVLEVRLIVNGTPVRGTNGLSRSDVATVFPGHPTAESSGFAFVVEANEGLATIEVEAFVAPLGWLSVGRFQLLVTLRRNGNGRRLNRVSRIGAANPRIVVDGRLLNRLTTGTERYLQNILHAIVTCPKASLASLDVLVWQMPEAPIPGVRYILSDHLAAVKQADVFFKTFPSSEARYLEEMLAARRCVFLPHDLILFSHPEYLPNLVEHTTYVKNLIAAAEIATTVIAISTHNRADMAERLGLAEGHLATILHGGPSYSGPEPTPADLPAGLTPGSFLLCVGTDYRHKNVEALISAFRSVRSMLPALELVRVGPRFQVCDTQTAVTNDCGPHLNHVSELQLQSLYKYAHAFIYPSAYEGFGLPPLEAMRYGTPVAASSATSIPEVCGDAALLFDPHEPECIRNALIRISTDKRLRNRLHALATRRASRFTWRQTAEKTLDLLLAEAGRHISIYEDTLRSVAMRRVQAKRPFPSLILIVTHVNFATGGAGNEVRILRMLQFLRRAGFRTAVLLTTLDRKRMSLSERYAALEHTDLLYEIHPGEDHDRVAPMLDQVSGDPRVQPFLRWRQQEFTFCPDTTLAAAKILLHELQPSVVVAEYIWTSRVLGLVPHGVLRIIDTHDKFSNKASRVLAHGVPDELGVTEDEERAFFDRADSVLAIQPDEAAAFEALGSRAKIVTVGCDMEVPHSEPPTRQSVKRILIVGSANPINLHFVQRFVTDTWPTIVRSYPFLRLEIVGRVADAIRTQSTSVEQIGFSPDLGPIYERADIVVNPVAAGTGLKIKTIEALAQAKPLITTAEGAAGLPTNPKPYFLCADSHEQWVRNISLLVSDFRLRQELSAEAHRVMIRCFNSMRVYSPLLDLFADFGIFPDTRLASLRQPNGLYQK